MASRAIGMSKMQAIRYVALTDDPPGNPFLVQRGANCYQRLSLVYAIGVPEILRRAHLISASTHQPFLAYITAR